jgi:hypothetical protein
MEILKRPGSYEHMNKVTTKLVAGILKAAEDAGHEVCGSNINGMFGFFFTKGPVKCFADAAKSDTNKFALWHREMLKRGDIFYMDSLFVSLFVFFFICLFLSSSLFFSFSLSLFLFISHHLLLFFSFFFSSSSFSSTQYFLSLFLSLSFFLTLSLSHSLSFSLFLTLSLSLSFSFSLRRLPRSFAVRGRLHFDGTHRGRYRQNY